MQLSNERDSEQVRLQEKLLRQTETLQALEQMGHAITSTFDRQIIFQEVLTKLHELLGAQGVFVLLLQGDHLVFSASSQTGADDPTGRRISAASGVAGQVLATGRAQALFGDEARKRTFEDFVRALGYRPGALLVAPLRLRGNLIGVLEAMHQRPDGFTEEDLPILEAAASWTAIAVQNAGLVRQLNASRERLRQLARQVVTAQEKERRRISRELHDEAGQALTALKITLGMLKVSLAAEHPDVARQLAEAVETTDQTMEQIRRLAHGLHPLVLDKLGLGAAAEALCADFVRQTDLDVQTNIEALPQLDEQSAISLYRVLQEALTNAARHAEASVIMVRLALEGQSLVLAVSDNGRGFEATELTNNPHSGLGLAGMQERVELLGGQLGIDAAPGHGTRIIARIPCPDQQEGS
jgi:signal transduction histidine kinase